MYRIRFHGRGGQGMKTASRILGTAFFLEGFEVQDAPRYGAERRGAPIFAYVRADREAINERGIIGRPDLVIVADESLVPIAAAGVMTGITGDTVILINSTVPPDLWQNRLNITGPILTLPMTTEVEDRLEARFIGALCAGAAVRLVDVISLKSLKAAIGRELEPLGPEIVKKNMEKALIAYNSMDGHAGCVKEGGGMKAEEYERPTWIDLPFDEAALSAPVIHGAATSELMKTGLWRTMRPLIDYDQCNRCWWLCSTFCPDGAIRINDEGYPEIDYEHCKGCMICLANCPPHAISAIPEEQAKGRSEGGKKS
ncbi:MAG: 2-oxoacid:acceptor oxidoreductase family protein [Proteobacteria bacterium]|nr:2-oxoacid:acceptor oxidoreductase family protein [Pseudomonadota bacterium]